MSTKVQEQNSDASHAEPGEESGPTSSIAADHQDLERGEAEGPADHVAGATISERSERPQQPADPRPAANLQLKQEEEAKVEAALAPSPPPPPPPLEAPAPTAVPPLGEGKGAKRMMEDDGDAFKEMPDVCQEAREPGRAMLLPDLFGEAQEAHSSLAAGRVGGCAKVEQAIPCLSNMGSENQRKRFRGFSYKETEGPQVAYERLQELLFQWLKPEARSKEEIVEQLVLEQFLNLLPEEVQRWVRERHPENGDEAVALAEDYQFLHPEPGRRPYPERARQRASARSWLR